MSEPQSLVGLPAQTAIVTSDGRLIVKQGEIITNGVIEAARNHGLMDELMKSAESVSTQGTIRPFTEYVEIGEEEPFGVHPE